MPKAPVDRKRQWLIFMFVTFGVCSIAAAAMGVRHYQLNHTPVSAISVTGERELVNSTSVQNTLQPYANKELINVDIERIRSSLLSLPWVKEVSLRRQWPNALEIRLFKHRAVAQWQEGSGKRYLLSDQGALIDVHADSLNGVQLLGPKGQQLRVLNEYGDLLAFFAQSKQPSALARLRLDARDAWQLELQGGPTVRYLERNKVSALERLHVALSAFTPAQLSQAQSIDLRYNNGFAIHWRKEDVKTS